MKKQDFVKQLRDIVAIESITENREENKRLVRFVTKMAPKKAVIKEWSSDKADILIISNVETLSPDVCFMVHGDVVSAEKKQFKLKVVGDRLLGRGVCDMKFTIPMGIELLKEWMAAEKKGSYAFVMTTDEENGGFDGAKVLAEKYKFRPKLLIVPDGGDNMELIYRSKGVAQVLIESVGKPAHASSPWEGKNAFDDLIELAHLLSKKYKKNNAKDNWNTTCNIGQIHGGRSTNQVCADAVMKIDFRFPDTRTPNEVVTEVREIVKANDLNLKVSVIVAGDPIYSDVKDPRVISLQEVAEKITGNKLKLTSDLGSSDARFFKKSLVIMTKPDGGDIHGPKEWISLKSCMIFYEMFSSYLENYLE